MTNEVVPRQVCKGVQKVAVAMPLLISLARSATNRRTIMETRQIPDVLGQHVLAGGGTPDPGNAAFAAPEVGELHGPRRVFFLHRPSSTAAEI